MTLLQKESSLDWHAIREFAKSLTPGSRILDAGCGAGRELKAFRDLGFDAEGVDSSESETEVASRTSGCLVKRADLRMLTLPRGSFDGIWCHRTLQELDAVGCQRALATFFVGLKPGGILFVSIDIGSSQYSPEEYASLIKQSGFNLIREGRTQGQSPDRAAFVARRLGSS